MRKQDDPEVLGRQAARSFERMRGQQACAAALKEYKLHKPTRLPINVVIVGDDKQLIFDVKKHTFIGGKIDVRATRIVGLNSRRERC